MSDTITILPSRNREWGFFGTIRNEAEPSLAFEAASHAIREATQGSAEGVRDFLDSRDGRHFADMVVCEMRKPGATLESAILTSVQKHQGWRVGHRTAREHGIPHDLPYLTGWVGHYSIEAEMAASA